MNRTLIKTISLILVFSMTIAFAIGTIATYNSTSYLGDEIEGKIEAVTEEYANDFSAEFNHMEGLTDSLASYVETTFDVDAFDAAPLPYMDGYKEEVAEMIKSNLETVKSAHSLYVTFNPGLTGRDDEVWYVVRDDGEMEEIIADKNNKRSFELPYEKNMEYYFKPQGKDHGVWISSYFDEDIDEEVFSYSVAIYVDDAFIGVAGADINAGDTVSVIQDMSLYEGGHSALLDENGSFIVSNDEESAAEEKIIRELLGKTKEADSTTEAGILGYSYEDEDKILSYSDMRNGWTFITTQPAEAVYEPINSVTMNMAIMGLVLAVVFAAFLVAFARPFIAKTNTLEEENRELEILTIYQSRQAKIGEMVGNITHQWKQPLNTINLILANLLDSYRYGDLDEKRLEKSVRKVENIVDEMSETITDFSDFLKPAKEKEAFDVEECVDDAISLMEESINLHKIKTDIVRETDMEAYGYYNETTHVIFNLLNNARDAIIESKPGRREIIITISDDGKDAVRVSVMNTGDGIAPENADRIFEPYFTTRESSGGTGLGLYISKQIVEDRLGGRISAENVEGGVRFDVVIPAAKGERAACDGGKDTEDGKDRDR